MASGASKDPQYGAAYRHFGRVRELDMHAIEWADDQVAPVPYTLTFRCYQDLGSADACYPHCPFGHRFTGTDMDVGLSEDCRNE